MTTESVRLYVKGVFLGFKRYELFPFSHYQSPLFRSQCAQYSNTSLIHINGVETKKDAQFYMGKRVAFVYRVFLFISSPFLFPCRLTTLSRALRFAASGVRSPELTVLPELYVSFSSLRDIEFWWLFHSLSFLSHGPMSLFPFCRSALSSERTFLLRLWEDVSALCSILLTSKFSYWRKTKCNESCISFVCRNTTYFITHLRPFLLHNFDPDWRTVY